MNQQRNERGAFVNIFKYIKVHDHEAFYKYTRMEPQHFEKILSLVKHKLLKRSRRECLSPEFRLAMTLKYLAHGGSFLNLSWEFRVGQSTVSKVIAETCDVLWEVLYPLYFPFPTKEEWCNISERFLERWDFPNTLGAIDGKHVQIQCPLRSGSIYYNYKHTFSLILMACCDADYKFIWADIGAYGAESDGGVFRRSKIGKKLENGSAELPEPRTLPGSNILMPYFFVADEAFPLKQYIMRPYPGKYLGEKKKIFLILDCLGLGEISKTVSVYSQVDGEFTDNHCYVQ